MNTRLVLVFTATLLGYAARNAVLPQVSSFALSLGFVVGGTLIMEMVFSYQGIGYTLSSITAVVLGGASLKGGQGKIIGAVLGTLLIGMISNIMILSRVSGYWQEIVIGCILIGAIWLDLAVQKRSGE